MSQPQAQMLLNFIDNSPSPWHVAISIAKELEIQDFQCLDERDAWKLEAGGRYYVVRDGSSLIGFVVGDGDPIQQGFRMIGAHTDSPGLRVKPYAPYTKGPMVRLGVEVYGGPILATFTDRDLSLAGRRENRGQTTFLYVSFNRRGYVWKRKILMGNDSENKYGLSPIFRYSLL